MRRVACLIVTLAFAALPAAPARTQTNLPPHAWLFGAWTGGIFPPPSVISAQECLAMPVVIFTRDIVMRAVLTDTLYTQRLVAFARATGDGVEFRFAPTAEGVPLGPFGLSRGGNTTAAGFGCISPDILHVQRRTENEITFPGCTDFPYPLLRCPAR
jgi:hypothetical protein